MGTLGITMLTTAAHYQAVSIDHDGDVPVYIQLADILRARIEAGELAPRRPVPSKRSIMQEYGVAGGTIDKAMAILRDEGLVRTVIGRGIYVTAR
jgi:DNA-binding GntR family transcriptional regulator